MAMLYDDFIALRDGKLTEKRAREIGLTEYKEGQKISIVGCLHNFKCGGAMPEECPWGTNNTSDNR